MDDVVSKRRPSRLSRLNLEIARREQPRLDVGLDFDPPNHADTDNAADLEAFDDDGESFDIQTDQDDSGEAESGGESGGAGPGGCPHVDRNDDRCSHRFSLGRIDQAFNVCFGSYRGCPHYHRINNEVEIDPPLAALQSERARTLIEIRVIAAGARARSPLGLDRGQAGVGGLRQTGS